MGDQAGAPADSARSESAALRFRTLADDAPFLIWMSDALPERSWFNRSWLELVGQPLERQLGSAWLSGVHPDDAPRCRATCAAEGAARRSFSLEYRLRARDGSWRWILERGSPHWLPDGSFAGYLGSGVDITERRSSAEAVLESQRRYQTLAESLPHLVWTCNPDGWCDYLSRQWVEYTGRPESEQLGYAWAEHLHPEDRERARAAWAQATARGHEFDVEFRIRRGDGVYRWFKTRAVPLRDLSGRIIKWFGSNTDFDDHKRLEQRLETQLGQLSLLDRITRAIGERQDLSSIFEVVLRSLKENLPLDFGCVCLPGGAGDVLTVAAAAQGAREHAGLREGTQLPVNENGLARCLAGQLVYEPDTASVPFPLAQRLAAAGLRALVLAPLPVEGRVFGVLVAARAAANTFASTDCEFLRQLSEHVGLAAQQAQLYGALQRAYDDLRRSQDSALQHERLRALGQMAGGIAHNINNAISPVALYTEWLLEQEPGLSARGREYLGTIQRAIADVALMVAGMREFYRQREPQLVLTPVDLNEVVRQAVELTRARWSDMPQQRGAVIQLQLRLATEPAAFQGIASEIREALTNLIFNAADAMPEGGTLTLRTMVLPPLAQQQGAAPGRSRVILEVSDDGIGMSEDIRQRCLEPFVTTKGERGTGLGLALVYGVVQRHGASIEVESRPQAGTTVRIIFPITEQVPAPSPPAPAAVRTRAKLEILLVDDDALVLKSLRDTLAGDGHHVTAVQGGEAGIAAFLAAQQRQQPFALVITDLGMPHVDGRKVARAVKEASPATPVILLTGWGQRISDEGSAPSDVDVVLSKPPRLRQLRETVARLYPEPAAEAGGAER